MKLKHLAAIAISSGAVGLFMLGLSRAATYVSSREAEDGTVRVSATVVNSTDASGGKSVKFGAGSTHTPPPTPPSPGSPWSVPFLSRTSSGPITCNGQSNVTISGKQFVNIGSDRSSIRITNCNNVVITANDFKDVAQAVTVEDSTNVTISWNRYQNITGPHQRNGTNRANFTQWVNSRGGAIHDNKGVGGDTEDIVSIYKSGGKDAANPLIIERNAFEGTNWSSGSGSGMMIGDDGGSHIIARNNTLLSPGAVGIGIPGGTSIKLLDNIIYGARRSLSNVGIYIWNQYDIPCSGHEVARNKVKWFNDTNTVNSSWNAGNCGPIAGWSTNDWNADIDPTDLRVAL